jgi:hypothetical protein
MTTNFFSPLSFVNVFGSGIRDPRTGIRDPGSGMGKNQDPGPGINIPDPQHWFYLSEAPSPLMTFILHPLYTLYTCIQYTYSHREGVTGGELTREKVRRAIVHKAGRKYQHD